MSDSKRQQTGRKSAYVARNRAALLRATQNVLAEHGMAATVELVAERAEIAVSTIYKHFENKEALFEAAFIEALLEWEKWTENSLQTVEDPAERLVFPMRLMLKVPETHPVFASLIAKNPLEFLMAVPRTDLGLESALSELARTGAISTHELTVRATNMIRILTTTMIELCTNPRYQLNDAQTSVSIGLEILGFSTTDIDNLMSRPLPSI